MKQPSTLPFSQPIEDIEILCRFKRRRASAYRNSIFGNYSYIKSMAYETKSTEGER